MEENKAGGTSKTVEVIDDRIELSTQPEPIDTDKLYKNRDWLFLNHTVLGNSPEEMADKVGVSVSKVADQLDKYDITGDSEAAWIKNSPWKQEDILRREYHQNKKSGSKLAEEWGVDSTLIYYHLDKYDIPIRSRKEALEIRFNRDNPQKYKDKQWLQKQYTSLGKTAPEIASQLNVSTPTIQYFLHKYGIEVRSDTEAALLRNSEMVDLGDEADPISKDTGEPETDTQTTKSVGMNSYTGPSLGIDSTFKAIGEQQSTVVESPWRDEEWLRAMYEKYGNTDKIAFICGKAQSTIINWMDIHGIERDRPTADSYTLGELIEAIEACADDIGEPLTYNEYQNWAEKQDDNSVPYYIRDVADGNVRWSEALNKSSVLSPTDEVECPTGEILKTLRTEAGLSQPELAEIIDTHKGVITMIENDRYTPKADLASRLNDIDWDTVEPLNRIECPTGKELKNLRENAGLTQAELADVADVHPTTISDIERGATPDPLTDTKKKINAICWKDLKTEKEERLKRISPTEIRERRKELQLSQKVVAEHMGIKQGVLSQYERNKFNPSEDFAAKLRNIDWDLLKKESEELSCPTGNELRELRKSAGVSQKAVADHINVSPTAISSTERGTTIPRDDLIKKINSIDWDLLAEQNNAECPTGDEFSQLRQNAGVSQKRLAELTELSASYISLIENDKTNPSLEKAKIIRNICWDEITEADH